MSTTRLGAAPFLLEDQATSTYYDSTLEFAHDSSSPYVVNRQWAPQDPGYRLGLVVARQTRNCLMTCVLLTHRGSLRLGKSILTKPL